MKALAAIFDVIPGWCYALLIAGLLLTNGVSLVRVHVAQTGEAMAKLETQTLRTDHATALAQETGKVLATERKLGAALATQEKKDADAQKTVADLRADLRALSRAAGGLRDPNATACRHPAAGETAAGAGPGANDASQAGGLLSEPLEKLLLTDSADADAINIAYASCREDAMNVRQILNSQVSPPAAGAGSASPGSP